MMKLLLALVLIMVPGAPAVMADEGDVRLTVVFDNNPGDEGLGSAWGFACLIEGPGGNLLFDTGLKGEMLMANMSKLGIDPGSIDAVVLSHAHNDHSGGLIEFLKARGGVPVYLLQRFPDELKQEATKLGAKVITVEEPLQVLPGMTSTGPMEAETGFLEQSIVVESKGGPLVVTGCAHPGIVKIVEKTLEMTESDGILAALGGFHLLHHDEESLHATMSRLKEIGVVYDGPCHCSGDAARKAASEGFDDRYLELNVGSRLSMNELAAEIAE